MNYLSRNPTYLNISYSWNGLGKHVETLYCGINKPDKTLYRLVHLNYEITQAQPLSFSDLDSVVRNHARDSNIHIGRDKYKAFHVTSEPIDIGKKDKSTAKWRAVIAEPSPTLNFVRGTADSSYEEGRLIHIFYGEVSQSSADLANMEGGSGAGNVSKFRAITDTDANVLQLKFNDSKAVMPTYVENFFYPSSVQMKQLLKEAADCIIGSEVLKEISTGNSAVIYKSQMNNQLILVINDATQFRFAY